MTSADPGAATCRDRTAIVADVFSHSDKVILASQQIGQTELVPYLRESRVDIVKNAAACCARDFRIREKAHDVEEEIGFPYAFHDLRAGKADEAPVAFASDSKGILQVVLSHDLPEVTDVDRGFKRTVRA